jgi:hypothetical protein
VSETINLCHKSDVGTPSLNCSLDNAHFFRRLSIGLPFSQHKGGLFSLFSPLETRHFADIP